MGSPDFSLPSLAALIQAVNVVGVVTQPDRPSGRGRQLTPPPVKVLAQAHHIPVIQPEKLKEPSAMAVLTAWQPDAIVVAAFGQILRKDVLALPKYGCINVHASLLPRWRGAAPIQAAILAGDDETGVTIMQMAAGLDTGGMYSQRTIRITEDMTAGRLSDQLAKLGAELLVETLPHIIDGELTAIPQDDSLVTYAGQIRKGEGLLDYNQPAAVLARKVRAYHPWPGAFFPYESGVMKVHQAHVCDDQQGAPGKIYQLGRLPALATCNGMLVLDVIQLPGKRAISGQDFLRGQRNTIFEELKDD